MSRRALLLAATLLAGSTVCAEAQTAPGQVPPAGGRGAAAFQRLDANADGRVTQDEYMAVMRQRFAVADVDRDGNLSIEELPAFLNPNRRRAAASASAAAPQGPSTQRLSAMIRRLDRNGDGKLSFEELMPQMQRWFTRHDANGDGAVTQEEARSARRRAPGATAPAGPAPAQPQ